jgi:hypothetical protein
MPSDSKRPQSDRVDKEALLDHGFLVFQGSPRHFLVHLKISKLEMRRTQLKEGCDHTTYCKATLQLKATSTNSRQHIPRTSSFRHTKDPLQSTDPHAAFGHGESQYVIRVAETTQAKQKMAGMLRPPCHTHHRVDGRDL